MLRFQTKNMKLQNSFHIALDARALGSCRRHEGGCWVWLDGIYWYATRAQHATCILFSLCILNHACVRIEMVLFEILKLFPFPPPARAWIPDATQESICQDIAAADTRDTRYNDTRDTMQS